MATPLKNFPTLARSSPESRLVAQIAQRPAMLQAGRWFARERHWINEQHLNLCRIPAPTFFESARAEWFRAQLESLGWSARLDRSGNVLAQTDNGDRQRSYVLSAHLDTVFAPNRPEDIYFASDGRLVGPGVSDNGSGLTALLALGRILRELPELENLAESILIVANVGEEGEGNLSGMRYLCRQASQLSEVKAFLVLDGPSTDHITAQALSSRRFEVLFTGPGGHSWNDSGTPNPIHALSDAITGFTQAVEASGNERKARYSHSFSIIEGGSSINSIPTSARAKLDLRSEEPAVLDELSAILNTAVERSLERENRSTRGGRLTAKIKELGSRPGGKLPVNSPLLQIVQAVDGHLTIRSRIDCASTDANVPLSLGLPAVSIGAGGLGGGAHTHEEWYQPEGRELGLRRILLILAAMLETAS